jgi:hypothetical protein
MKWIKDVVIDIAVTLVVLVYALWQPAWAKWVLMIYTPLMMLLKGVAVANPMLAGMASKKGAEVPFWFHHVLYAASVLALLTARWYIMAGLWIAIWLMSIATDTQSRTSTTNSKRSAKGGKLGVAKG